jgi:hypothetical protein
MAFPERPRGARPTPTPADSLIANRPKSRLPEGYSPSSTLPPGYMPPLRDLEKTGAIARKASKTPLTRNQVLGLAAGGIVVVALVAVALTLIISALIVNNAVGGSGADTAVDNFYSALRSQSYTQAYAMLSPAYKADESQDAFTSYYTQLDTTEGTISAFTVDTPTTSGNQTLDTVHVTRSILQGQTPVDTYMLDTVHLVQTNGAWTIDSVDSKNLDITATPIS